MSQLIREPAYRVYIKEHIVCAPFELLSVMHLCNERLTDNGSFCVSDMLNVKSIYEMRMANGILITYTHFKTNPYGFESNKRWFFPIWLFWNACNFLYYHLLFFGYYRLTSFHMKKKQMCGVRSRPIVYFNSNIFLFGVVAVAVAVAVAVVWPINGFVNLENSSKKLLDRCVISV